MNLLKICPTRPTKRDHSRDTLLDEIKYSLELLNAHILLFILKVNLDYLKS